MYDEGEGECGPSLGLSFHIKRIIQPLGFFLSSTTVVWVSVLWHILMSFGFMEFLFQTMPDIKNNDEQNQISQQQQSSQPIVYGELVILG